MRAVLLSASAVALSLLAAPLAAAGDLTATVVSASSNYQGYPPSDAVDMAVFTDWASNSQGSGSYIDFDLGSAAQLNSVTLTDRLTSGGPNGSYAGGTSDFTTRFTLASYADASFSKQIASDTFSKATPTSNSPDAFVFTAPTSLSGEYFRYTVDAANGLNPGLNNITFSGDAISAAPEPNAWVLMLGGVGVLGGLLRVAVARRREDDADSQTSRA